MKKYTDEEIRQIIRLDNYLLNGDPNDYSSNDYSAVYKEQPVFTPEMLTGQQFRALSGNSGK